MNTAAPLRLVSLVAAGLLAIVASAQAAGYGVVWSFGTDTAGRVPNGFHEEVGKWRVVEDAGRKVVAQLGASPDKVFNVLLETKFHPVNVELTVRLKAVSGRLDQGGGLIWRAQDKSNYYIARYNPLEDNFRVYKVERGKRTMFKNADIPHAPGWHTLRVKMIGKHIECFYDSKKYLECDDATFSSAGMIGLWSKADAQSEFADLSLTASE